VYPSSLYHGYALWNPDSVKTIYNHVSIGGVRYTNEGVFYRMFNVTLPWNHTSDDRLSEPGHYKPLDCGKFVHSHETPFVEGGYYTANVSSEKSIDNPLVQDPRESVPESQNRPTFLQCQIHHVYVQWSSCPPLTTATEKMSSA